MNLDYPRDVHDLFAETDPAKLAEYRAWAHRALDTLIDFRLACEVADAHVAAPHFGGAGDDLATDSRARELHADVLMFANRIVGKKASERNAELFNVGDAAGMRAALHRVIIKLWSAWPVAPFAASGARRAILPRDLEDALRQLDRGGTPFIFSKSGGRETDFVKEQCRVAGALWSLRLEAMGATDFTAQVASAFKVSSKGVQGWKLQLSDPAGCAAKLGYDHASHIEALIARAKLLIEGEADEDFASYLAWNVFGELTESVLSLRNIGLKYQSLLQKSQ